VSTVRNTARHVNGSTRIATNDAIAFILGSAGRFVAVEFRKRTTGTIRRMVCRLGVRKHWRGGPRAYDAVAQRLITVYDLGVRGYRSIPVEGIRRVKVRGAWVRVSK
jgi:hypothetical protein